MLKPPPQAIASTFRPLLGPRKWHHVTALLRRFDVTVGGVLCVFVFLYIACIRCVVLPWMGGSVRGALHLWCLTLSTGTALYCYFSCMFMNPGSVPMGWQPDKEHAGAVQEVKKKGGAPRYCNKCDRHKPPRSHHCRVCKRCVLRMDHHCPWVNNCVGHGNYHSFFLLLVYASMALVHANWLLATHGLHCIRAALEGASLPPYKAAGAAEAAGTQLHRRHWRHAVVESFAFCVALPVGVSLLVLLRWHVMLLACNKTTIEHQEGVTAEVTAQRLGTPLTGARPRHPYDLGALQNAREVFGRQPLQWLLPPVRSRPGGLEWPTAFDQQDDWMSR